MNKIIPVGLLLALLVLPAVLFAGFALLGERHLLENNTIDDIDFLADSEQEVEVVFFGYAGCAYICPNALVKIADALNALKTETDNVKAGGIFVDINADTQLRRAGEYGKIFSADIQGFNTNAKELERLKESFRLRIKAGPDNKEELLHTDHFFVLKRVQGKWRIERVLANNTSRAVIKQEVKNALEGD